MKKLFALITLIANLTAIVNAEEINLAWDYAGDTNYISFTLWVGQNTTNFIMPVMTTTNKTINYTNTSPTVLYMYVTASNTLKQINGPPSNMIKLPGNPIAPDNLRLISITIRPAGSPPIPQ